MANEQLADGTRVRYKSRAHEGVGKVLETYKRKTGVWVIVLDSQRKTSVTLRPSQVFKMRVRSA